ncbi:MAG: hypothetical protein KAR19_14535 [Bacteroidales bacterium]|nr:hypothetical protein [Bacteroidales bacterium]
MNQKSLTRNLVALLLIVLVASFSYASPAKRFSPVGIWEYSAPSVPEGYQNGEMIIVKKGKEYSVTMALNEYNKTEAESVEYKKKTLKFTLYVENEKITISGTFDKDKFTGTGSYFEGTFDITAARSKKQPIRD